MSEHANPPSSPFPPRGGRVGDGGAPRHSGPAPGAVKRARAMRKAPTVAERLLWAELRKLKQNIRRQVPIGPYIANFAHHASRVVIEVDGVHHEEPEAQARDARRTAWLNGAGYRVVRFREKQVREQLGQVVDRIAAEIAAPPSPTLPPRRGKRDACNGSTAEVKLDSERRLHMGRVAQTTVGCLRTPEEEARVEGFVEQVQPLAANCMGSRR